jgi:hypothetical protein
MKPAAEKIFLEFDFCDKEIAEIIANAAPPDGVKVGKPATFIKASGETGGIFVQVVIEVANGIRDLAIGILSAWLYDCCVKSGKKTGRVNRKQVVFNKRSIRQIIKEELKSQSQRDAQRKRDNKSTKKKRS